ncbi:Ferric/cupric reductase transmembrane component B [Vanrija pseudolonga]|uniref:Ferric/cupric reductase transmembrane component B n=1 Tax=Vanrija pseudolonga TaxID=143232 RepID=A0AAF1BPG8_9TREE|nr:Ferric/cupric reductase transmembrane component B [Vanrija pseudolonga]
MIPILLPLLLVPLALLLLPAASAAPRTSSHSVFLQLRPGLCGEACQAALGSVQFSDAPPTRNIFEAHARSKLWLGSAVHCLDVFCESPGDIGEGYAAVRTALERFGGVDVGPAELWRNDTMRDEALIVDTLVSDPRVVYDVGVRPALHAYNVAYDTLYTWDLNQAFHHGFGEFLYLLLLVLIAQGLVSRLARHTRSGKRPADVEGESKPLLGASGRSASLGSRFVTWYRRTIDTPALFGYTHVAPAGSGWLSIPTRLEAAVVAVYVGFNVVFTFVGYTITAESIFWPGRKDIELIRYVADRTGIMCFWNLPLLWALAGRNNVVLWLTTWSYCALPPPSLSHTAPTHAPASLNLFHRWVARVATLQAVIHSLAYLYLGLERGQSLQSLWSRQYWAMGVIATFAMVLLLPLSVRPLRERAYELFLQLHIWLAFATLVLLFYHVKVMRGAYDGWLWACLGLWAFDRGLRYARVAALAWSAPRGNNTLALATGEEHGLLRLSVEVAACTPAPGAYYFLYTPRSLTPWENHPMTLASAEPSPGGKGTTLHFLIAPQAGATKRIADEVAAAGGKTHMRVLVEGPYGEHHDVSAFDRVLLIAGGSGVTAVLPYAAEQRDKADVAWIVPNAAYARDVCSRELAGSASAHVYVTRQAGVSAADVWGIEEVESSEDDDEEMSQLGEDERSSLLRKIPASRPKLLASSGRPPMRDVLAQAVSKLVGGERLAVLACGPPVMMDDLRLAVSEAYGHGLGQLSGDRLVYFEDAFGW